MIKYLIRIDDVCDNFIGYKNLYDILSFLNSNNIVPLVGIIPYCKDKSLLCKNSPFKFSVLKKNVFKKKIEIALDGFEHRYINSYSGLLNLFSKRRRIVDYQYRVNYNELINLTKKNFKIEREYDLNDTLIYFPFKFLIIIFIPLSRLLGLINKKLVGHYFIIFKKK